MTTPTNPPALPRLPEKPEVTVFINCKNGAATIRRCIESILKQTYADTYILFHDGGSTDGTLEIVAAYQAAAPQRITVRQQHDTNPAIGLFRALQACEGDLIGSCMADEALHPHAVATAVREFQATPEVGAIYGDANITDSHGKILGAFRGQPFSIERYLCREIDQPFVATFFRRAALSQVGLTTRDWRLNVGEFELIARLGMKYPIRYVPGILADYGVGENTLSTADFRDHTTFVKNRTDFFRGLFAEPDLPPTIASLRHRAVAGLYLFIAERLVDADCRQIIEQYLLEAMRLQPDGQRVLDIARRIYEGGGAWNFRRLERHIRAHLRHLPPSQLVCIGAGNDFASLMASGVFTGHTVLAVIDNGRPAQPAVAGVPVIGIDQVAPLAADAFVVTSSRWMHVLRQQALDWSARADTYVPVV